MRVQWDASRYNAPWTEVAVTPSADFGSFAVDLDVPKTLRFGERRVYLRAVYPDSDTPGDQPSLCATISAI